MCVTEHTWTLLGYIHCDHCSCGRAKLELGTNMDDDTATLAWLEDALRQAFELRRPELWAYLEAVLEEVLFEMELATGSS
jgi:hypothetical protein